MGKLFFTLFRALIFIPPLYEPVALRSGVDLVVRVIPPKDDLPGAPLARVEERDLATARLALSEKGHQIGGPGTRSLCGFPISRSRSRCQKTGDR